jgi:hypothetical protein
LGFGLWALGWSMSQRDTQAKKNRHTAVGAF